MVSCVHLCQWYTGVSYHNANEHSLFLPRDPVSVNNNNYFLNSFWWLNYTCFVWQTRFFIANKYYLSTSACYFDTNVPKCGQTAQMIRIYFENIWHIKEKCSILTNVFSCCNIDTKMPNAMLGLPSPSNQMRIYNFGYLVIKIKMYETLN